MPDWSELAFALADHVETDPKASPPEIAQRYEQRFGRVQLIEAIREALHPEKARPGKAHRTFAQLPFDTVYTTNFDLILEEAYAEATRPFRSLVGELQMPFHAGQIASSIVKMHGDLRHEEHIIVTREDYQGFMEKYPVIATHLSAMLITRTPLFIGYGLLDPDFQNIRRIVRSRLGVFERMSYVIQFDVSQESMENALSENLHIISLDSSAGASRDELLSLLFKEVQSELDTKSGVAFRGSRPDLFEEIGTERIQEAVQTDGQASVIETTSRLCFVLMPFGKRFDEIYRLLVSPAVEDNGLTVLRADEISASGFVMEQIRTAIQQSRLCIADLTGSNPNVLFEIGYAQASNKPLVLIAEEGSQFPFDVAHQRVIVYGQDLENARVSIRQAISAALSKGGLEKSSQFLSTAQYRSAIASAAVVLEQRLRDALLRRAPEKYGRFGRMSLGQMVGAATKRKLLKRDLGSHLYEVVKIRNRAVHEVKEPEHTEAEFVLTVVRQVLEALPVLDGIHD